LCGLGRSHATARSLAIARSEVRTQLLRTLRNTCGANGTDAVFARSALRPLLRHLRCRRGRGRLVCCGGVTMLLRRLRKSPRSLGCLSGFTASAARFRLRPSSQTASAAHLKTLKILTNLHRVPASPHHRVAVSPCHRVQVCFRAVGMINVLIEAEVCSPTTNSIRIPGLACQPRNFYHQPPANNCWTAVGQSTGCGRRLRCTKGRRRLSRIVGLLFVGTHVRSRWWRERQQRQLAASSYRSHPPQERSLGFSCVFCQCLL
jgi:hypothetical protein